LAYINIDSLTSLFIAFTVTKNKLISTIDVVKKEWAISIEIKPTGKADGPTNILHLTNNDAKTRVPGIWFKSKTNKLRICFPVDKKDDCWEDSEELEDGKYSVVSIEQRRNEGNL